jgi:hypothetical protein
MLDLVMIGLFIILPVLMIGLTKWCFNVVEQGSEEK